MMIFYYCPILGLTYYYSEPNIIMDLDELPNVYSGLSFEDYYKMIVEKGIVLIDSFKDNSAVEYIHRIISNF